MNLTRNMAPKDTIFTDSFVDHSANRPCSLLQKSNFDIQALPGENLKAHSTQPHGFNGAFQHSGETIEDDASALAARNKVRSLKMESPVLPPGKNPARFSPILRS